VVAEVAKSEGQPIVGSPVDHAEAGRLLSEGRLAVEALIAGATNVTLFGRVTPGGRGGRRGPGVTCVYKPIRGEQPLWDFPDGTLAHREVAAYLLSEAAGWRVVPPTVLRNGPFGPGMVQLWMETDESVDLLQLFRSDHPALRRMALFDHVVNNADRKIGHLLPVPGGHVYGVDHGVCFAEEPKLRTVLWGWRGQPFTPDEVDGLARLREALDADLGARLRGYLSTGEIEATAGRLEDLVAAGVFPEPDPDRRAIPWPPV
jgi:uncharacterized repeat protein (TIGR03843 family)